MDAVALTVFAVGDPAGVKNVGNGQGKQFITGACLSNADCASGCCAGLGDGAVCSGPAVGNAAGKRGCGFPNVGGNGAATGNNGGKANTGGNNANCPPCKRGFEYMG